MISRFAVNTCSYIKVFSPHIRVAVCSWDIEVQHAISPIMMVWYLLYFMLYFIPVSDVMKISSVLADVKNWEQLAGWLNMDNLLVEGIKTECGVKYTSDVERAECYRSELVQYFCDQQEFKNPSKVAEDIIAQLELMDMRHQAEQLRQLDFGKVVHVVSLK